MTASPPDPPPIALSVRQPWAWAIIHGGKDIENRTLGSIRSGRMDCRRIAIHAATGMREKEYRWAVHKLQEAGATCPRPDELVRGAIIGAVDVIDIVSQSDSPWFGGAMGLVLENPAAIAPIPAKGALGYFRWERAAAFAPVAPWMRRFDRANGDTQTLSMFGDMPPAFREVPKKPYKG